MTNIVILVLGWISYYLIHSALASKKVKDFFYTFLKKNRHFYRLGYNLVSFLGFAGLVYYQKQLKYPIYLEKADPLTILGIFLMVAGVLIAYFGFRGYRSAEFFGISQLKSKTVVSHQPLFTGGLNKYSRHPLYSGVVALMIGLLFFYRDLPTLIFVSCTLIYLILGVYWEEKKLIKMYGDEYLAYRKRVKAIIPFIL